MARKEEEARKYRKAKLQRVENKRQRRKNAYKKTWKSAGCTEGQDFKAGICVWSKKSKECRRHGGLYYSSKAERCACKKYFHVWNVKSKRCEASKSKDCEAGKAFDQKRMMCRWTRNSRTCQSRGALYFVKIKGVKQCACPKSFSWNGKKCLHSEGSPATCAQGKSFDN